VNGTHYTRTNGTALPTSVTIPTGSSYVDIPFKATSSAVGGMYFDVTIPCPCDANVTDSHRVTIYDNDVSITSIAQAKPCSGTNNGTITVSASGGSGSYEYSINNGSSWQNSNVFSGLAAGNYTIQTRARGGCTTVSQQLTLTTLTSNAGADTTQCNNVFTMAGVQPATGETGAWTVVGESAGLSIANPTLYNTTVTLNLNQRETATLRWTINNGTCSAYDEVNIRYKPCELPVNPHIRSNYTSQI
jgi:hypothetical protein